MLTVDKTLENRNSNPLLVRVQNDLTSPEGSLTTSVRLQVHFLSNLAISILSTLFHTDVSFHVYAMQVNLQASLLQNCL